MPWRNRVDNNTTYCWSGAAEYDKAVEDEDTYCWSGIAGKVAMYPYGGEAKIDAACCHVSAAKDDGINCCGSTADNDAA